MLTSIVFLGLLTGAGHAEVSTDVELAQAEALRAHGFTDPRRVFRYYPSALAENFDQIEKNGILWKVAEYRELGVIKPVKMIQRDPNILWYRIADNVRPKLADLARLGFKNPIRMIERYPRLIGLNFERSIRPRWYALKDRWGATHEMVEGTPALLGASPGRIDGLHAFMTARDLYPEHLNRTLRLRCLRNLSAFDVAINLVNAGFTSVVDQTRALADDELLPLIFTKAKCADRLTNSSVAPAFRD